MRTHNGLFVSFEGISGVGKSYFCQQLHSLSQHLPFTFVSEMVDRTGTKLDRHIIHLLQAHGDRFFQNLYPLTTTFLLFSLSMYDTETKIRPALADGRILIKDRYLDTLAVYQAILLHPGSFDQQMACANELYTLGARWCPIPDVTFLIEDDFNVAIHRAQVRNGDTYRDDELAILRSAAKLYDAYAQYHASRIIRINRQELTNEHILQRLQYHLMLGQESRVK